MALLKSRHHSVPLSALIIIITKRLFKNTLKFINGEFVEHLLCADGSSRLNDTWKTYVASLPNYKYYMITLLKIIVGIF